jgi:hypothetical protein
MKNGITQLKTARATTPRQRRPKPNLSQYQKGGGGGRGGVGEEMVTSSRELCLGVKKLM